MNRIISRMALFAALLASAPVALVVAQPVLASYQPGEILQPGALSTPAPKVNSQSATSQLVAASTRTTLAVTSTITAPLPGPDTALTTTAPTTAVSTTTIVSSPKITLTAPVTSTAAVTAPVDASAMDTEDAGVLAGTIIANRTEASIRYFLEGQTYDLAPLRSVGLPLLRATAVLNLFNCDSGKSESDPACFWDPYLLKQDGFYEVVAGADAGAAANLILREAGAPPANQIWVQNRTGLRESIIVNNQVVELAPTGVQEFDLASEGPIIVHLRNCITQGGQTVCEWAPTGVEPGYYYGLVKSETTGSNGAVLTSVSLEGVVASSGEIVAQPPQGNCLLRVPTLNVRGGPGLEFPIVAKIRGSAEQPGSVIVIGFDISKQWLQVSERVAANGWITTNPDFIICTGDLAALPIAGGTLAAVLPTPTQLPAPAPEIAVAAPLVELPAASEPVVEAEPIEAPLEASPAEIAPVESTPVDAQPAAEAAATEVPQASTGIPVGLARIVVNNGFDQVIRFTLDHQYRVETDNMSGEWDLQPGQSISLLVYPGMIPFSASTPWRGLAGNANIQVEADQERALWLYFVPDPDGSGNWILQY